MLVLGSVVLLAVPIRSALRGVALPALVAFIGLGVSVTPWEEAKALESDNGALMLDVAELDDLSAVILLGIVFAIAPGLQEGNGMIVEAVRAGALQIAKIAVFVACLPRWRHVSSGL